LTRANIRDEVRTELGGSAVEVELADKDIDKALKDTFRVYNRFRPGQGFSAIVPTTVQKKYAITEPGLIGVVDMQFITDRLVLTDVANDPFFLQRYVDPYFAGDTWGVFDLRRQYHEDIKRLASAEPEWRGQWEGGTYYLYIDIDYPPDKVSYRYTFKWEPDETVVPNGMQNIPEDDVGWIMDYTAARSKVILGRVRGKFGGIPTPDGGSSDVDYDALIQEGKESMQELTDEIKRRVRPLFPLTE